MSIIQDNDLELFLGRNSCSAIWLKRPESVQSMYILQSAFASSIDGLRLISEARTRNVKVYFLTENVNELEHLFKLTLSEKESLPWQVVAITAQKRKFVDFGTWLQQEKFSPKSFSLVPFLDGVRDEKNIALFTRSCAHFGVDILMSCLDYLPNLDSQFGRLSCGSIEELEIVSYEEVKPTLYALKEQGYTVVTLSPHADTSLYNYSFSPKTVFILGAEREGVSEEAYSAADVTLSLHHYSKTVDSLNVATMGAITLFEYYRQQFLKTQLTHSTDLPGF